MWFGRDEPAGGETPHANMTASPRDTRRRMESGFARCAHPSRLVGATAADRETDVAEGNPSRLPKPERPNTSRPRVRGLLDVARR